MSALEEYKILREKYLNAEDDESADRILEKMDTVWMKMNFDERREANEAPWE